MLQYLGKIGTLCLVVTMLLLNGTVHEFAHSFTGHEDTYDCRHEHHDGASFEPEHHHCLMLDLQLPVFWLANMHLELSGNELLVKTTRSAALQTQLLDTVFPTLLRGPPATV